MLLLDEALTGQDQATKQACIGVIKEYLKRHQGSALIACHQIEDAIALGDVALLQCDDNQEKYWQSIPIAQGIHQYQQQLIETNSCKEPSQS
ncbi:ABC transporter ATP-binding protein, partial [Pseudoalteromonas sp. G24-MNA-CIBAN-0072]|uniref:ATP-binding cassette domain-containing protein n=1 Tax=Pseudoalteromonas sp. G24-MNA-CIBAN-0072 TaxID=3140418 RepID=UPI0033186E97